MPCPTPMHIVHSAYRPPRTPSSSVAVVARRAPLIPSGWPSAMAPPFGFTCSASSGSPRSRSTARAWAANASLSSTTSSRPTSSPARARSLRVAGTGPITITRGGTPAVASAGREPVGGRRALRGHQQRAGAVVHARRIARGHGATGPEGGLEPGERLQRGVAWMLVLGDLSGLLPARHRDGDDLLREAPAL